MTAPGYDDRIFRAVADIERMYARIDEEDHFRLLGLDRDASPEQVKARYVALAKRWHADAFSGIELGEHRAKLDAIFQRIAQANEALQDPERRTEHLTLLSRKAAGLSTDVEAILKAEGLVDRGLVELGRRRFAEAREAFAEAAQMNPDDPLIRTHLAWATYRMDPKRPEVVKSAQAGLKAALKTQENLPEAYRYLGTICLEAEQFDGAIRWLGRCLEWSPGDVEASRLLRLAQGRRHKQASANLGDRIARWFGKR